MDAEKVLQRRELREYAASFVDGVVEVMPQEAKDQLLRRAINAHLMDGSCHWLWELDERKRCIKSLAFQLKEGNLKMRVIK